MSPGFQKSNTIFRKRILQGIIVGLFVSFLFINGWVIRNAYTPPRNIESLALNTDNAMFEEVQIKTGKLSPLSSQSVRHQIRTNCSRILVAHEYIPYADHHGADSRLLDVLISLVAVCTEVRFVSYVCLLGPGNIEKWELPKPEHITALKKLGVHVDCRVGDTGVTQAVVDLLEEYNPMFIITSLWFWTWPTRPLYASLLLEAHQRVLTDGSGINQRYQARFIVLSDDVHVDRETKQLSSSLRTPVKAMDSTMDITSSHTRVLIGKAAKGLMLQTTQERVALVRALEKAVYSCADAIFAITLEDMTRMKELVHGVNVRTVRPTAKAHSPSLVRFDQRIGFIFVGTGQNPTNVAAVQWFISEVWPLIRRQLPKTSFLIAGSLPPGGIWATQLHNKEMCSRLGVSIVGFTKNLESVLSTAKVFVSPVRVASGFNTKNLLALTSGLPLVTTQYGATGLPSQAAIVTGKGDPSLEVAEFAQACIEMHTDARAWEAQRAVGLSIAQSFFSPSAVEEEVKEALFSMIKQLEVKHCQVFPAPFVVMLTNP